MFCHKCGKETVEDAAFCVYCGAKIVIPKSDKSTEKSDTIPVNIEAVTEESHPVAAPIREKSQITQKPAEKKPKSKAPSKIKCVISIHADDKVFAKRNLAVCISGITYSLHELNKSSFYLESDAKIVAYLDSSENGKRIKSEELIIPIGKVVNVEISLDEDDVLVAKITSEKDYVGSKAEANHIARNRRRLINKIVAISLGVFIVIGAPIIAYTIDSIRNSNDDSYTSGGNQSIIVQGYVETQLQIKCNYGSINDYPIEYVNSSFTSCERGASGEYIYQGTVTVKDSKGTYYSSSFFAVANHDSQGKGYDVDISYDGFKKLN